MAKGGLLGVTYAEPRTVTITLAGQPLTLTIHQLQVLLGVFHKAGEPIPAAVAMLVYSPEESPLTYARLQAEAEGQDHD